MNGYHTASQVGIGHSLEPGIFYQSCEFCLLWEFPDALHEVLVGFRIVGKELAHDWDRVEGVEVIELLEAWDLDLGELKAHEATPSPQDAVGLPQSLGTVCNVSNTKSNCV